MEKYIYELKLKVRDYECDLQGIVNNANYQHYLEHTRHEFLTSIATALNSAMVSEKPEISPFIPSKERYPCRSAKT